MSCGCIAGWRMTCVTDLNSKQTGLENNHACQDVLCVMVILCDLAVPSLGLRVLACQLHL